jgi:hypothetical protein
MLGLRVYGTLSLDVWLGQAHWFWCDVLWLPEKQGGVVYDATQLRTFEDKPKETVCAALWASLADPGTRHVALAAGLYRDHMELVWKHIKDTPPQTSSPKRLSMLCDSLETYQWGQERLFSYFPEKDLPCL